MVWKLCPASMCVFETVCHSVFFPVLVVCLSFGVALRVLVEMFLLEMGKTYQSIGLNILVTTREITEGNNFQKYNWNTGQSKKKQFL